VANNPTICPPVDGVSTVERPAQQRGLRPPWKPGESGNPAGRPRRKPLTDALIRILRERTWDSDRSAADQAAKALVERAISGDTAALRLLFERVEGPPNSPAEIGDVPETSDPEEGK
jgi:hypothetical protein